MLPTQQAFHEPIPLGVTMQLHLRVAKHEDKEPFGSGRLSFAIFLKYLNSDILVSYTRFFIRVASQKFLCL